MRTTRKAVVLVVIMLGMGVLVSSAGASTGSIELSLSSSSALASTTTLNTDGSFVTSDVSLDTADTNATMGSDSFLCGNVQYRATQKWHSGLWPNIVLWTYRSTFGVHVCHDKVTGKTALYDEAMDSTLGWGWCNNIVRSWAMNPNNASAHSYTKGCFNVLDKILVVKYPWARMTIGGNGGLWVRTTGVG